MHLPNDGVTVMLDFHKPMSATTKSSFENNIKQQAGVTHAEFSPYVPRLMFVLYDSNMTDSKSIRDYAQQLIGDTNHPARLISM